MRKTVLIILALITGFLSYGQTLTPEVISSGGNFLTQGGASLSSTLGEGIIETGTGTTLTLTQGFQQVLQLTVNITAQTNVTCFGGSDGSLTATVQDGVSNYTYVWSNGASTTNVSTTSNTISGLSEGSYTVTVTDGNNTTATATATITQPAQLVVSFTALADLCVDAGIQTGLGGGTPTGGVYSGTGVTDGGDGISYSFDPAAAGVGTQTLTYTFVDVNGCSNYASDDVEVFALPNVGFTAPADMCVDASVLTGLGGGTHVPAVTGIYSGPGVSDDGNGTTYTFDPATAGVGTHTLTYTYTDGNGCTNSASDDVEVFDIPDVTAASMQTSIDAIAWGTSNISGDLTNGYKLCLDPSGTDYYLGLSSLTSSIALKTGEYNPFFLNTTSLPADFYTWFDTQKGVNAGATPGTWQAHMWDIIYNTTEPIFYILFDGTNYRLIDGLMYGYFSVTQDLLIDGDYPEGAYTFNGAVKSTSDCMSQQMSLVLNVFDPPVVTDVTVQYSDVNGSPWTAVSGDLTTGYDVCFDPTQTYYYFDMLTSTDNFDYEPNFYNPFNIVPPAVGSDFWTYWSAYPGGPIDGTGASGTPGTWQNHVWKMITAQSPIFYVMYDGVDYMLVDGFQKDFSPGTDQNFRIDGNLPAGSYSYTGTVKTTGVCFTSNLTFQFNIILPTITCPAPVLVECTADIPAANINLPVVTGNAPLVVTHQGDVSDGQTCPETITRTYRVTDACGNFEECTQIITVNDITDPTITCPAPTTVECIEDVPAADITLPVTSDNCLAPVVVTHIGDVSDGNTCPETITRTYRATDACGNFAECTQLITVDDITDPTISCPAAIAIECIEDVPAADITLPVTGDNCVAAVVVTHEGDVSDGQTCPEIITRTYRVTDACGNFAECTQLITIDDVTDPTIICPAALQVECIEDVPAADITLPVTSDNCQAAVVVTHEGDVSDNLSCPETITRTYRATDACGNFAECTQIITIDDVTDPTIICPPAVSVYCIAEVPAPDITMPVVNDNCVAPLTVTHQGDVSDNMPDPEIITRTYRVTDACGNFAECTQIITVNHPTANAGLAVDVCEDASHTFNGTATNYSSVYWTGGSGTWIDGATLTATYVPGLNEYGPVTLTLHVVAGSPCTNEITSDVVITIFENAHVEAGSYPGICETGIQLSGSVTNAAAALTTWTTYGDGTFDNANSLTAFYTPGPNDVANGSVILELVATPANMPPCVNMTSDQVTLTIDQTLPLVDIGVDATICETPGTYTFSNMTVTPNVLLGLWTTYGDGTFDDPNMPYATYTVGANDIALGYVDIKLDVSPILPCLQIVNDQMRLYINKDAIVSAGSDASICHTGTYTITDFTAANYSSLSWTGGDGTFDDASLLAPTYTPGTGDIAAGTVVLTLTANPLAPCTNAPQASMTLSVITTTLACPANATEDRCQDQATIDAAFATWLGTATSSNGYSTGGSCDLTGSTLDPLISNDIWDRPIGGGPSISGLGPVSYSVYGPFTVDVSGLYTFNSVQSGWDGYIHVYENAFDPLNQLTGLLAGDDDGPGGIGTSEILDLSLTTGTSYYLITSGFAAGDFGSFVNTITGPGTGTCGGGSATATNDNTGAPLATGGSTTVTWSITDYCQNVMTCSATFTVENYIEPAVIFASNATNAPGQFYAAAQLEFCYDQTIDITLDQVLAGTGPFTIEWEAGGIPMGPVTVSQGQSLFAGTKAVGVYNVLITKIADSYGCEPSDYTPYNATFTVNPQPNVFLTINTADLVPFSDHEFCYDVTTIDLGLVQNQGGQTAVGTAPFAVTYTITGTNWNTSVPLTGVNYGYVEDLFAQLPKDQYGQPVPDTYVVAVTSFTDANGCALSQGALNYYVFNLIINPQPDVFLSINNVDLAPYSTHEFCYDVAQIDLELLSSQGGQTAEGTAPFDIEFTINNGTPISLTGINYGYIDDLLARLPKDIYNQPVPGDYVVQVTSFVDDEGCVLSQGALNFYNFTLTINPQPDVFLSLNGADLAPYAGYTFCNGITAIDLELLDQAIAGGPMAKGSPLFDIDFTITGTSWNTAVSLTDIDYGYIDDMLARLPVAVNGNPVPDTYTVQVTSFTDADGCVLSQGALNFYNFTMTIESDPLISFAFDGYEINPGENVDYCEGDNVLIEVHNYYGGVAPFSIEYTVTESTMGSMNGSETGVTTGFDLYDDNILPAGVYTIEVTSLEDANGCFASAYALGLMTGTLTIHAKPVVDEAPMVSSEDGTTWSDLYTEAAKSYNLCMDGESTTHHMLNISSLTANETLETGVMNEFYLDVTSVGTDFYTYWAARGVVSGATGWQGVMWQIINGQLPITYLMYDGTDYMLVDGLQYQAANLTLPLVIPGDYPLYNYEFTGTVESDWGCISEPFSIFLRTVKPELYLSTVPPLSIVNDEVIVMYPVAMDVWANVPNQLNPSYLWDYNNGVDPFITIDDFGTYNVTVTDMGCEATASLTVNEKQDIQLRQGWGILSTYINTGASFDVLLADLVAANNNIVVKDEDGHAFISYNGAYSNGLPNHLMGEGYQYYMSKPNQVLTVVGGAIDPATTTLSLDLGYNFIGYLRRTSAPVVQMMAPIASVIDIMKNEDGQVYWYVPSLGIWINQIGNLWPGKGYQLKLLANASFTYPANTVPFAKSDIYVAEPSYFAAPVSTGNNMTLGIPENAWSTAVNVGDEIGVFNQNGDLVGSGVYDNDNMAISLWGDNETTKQTNALANKEVYTLQLWNSLTGATEELIVTEWIEGNGTYGENDIAIVGKLAVVLESEMSLNNYPNPFRDVTTITFNIPEDGKVRIELFNSIGKRLEVITDREYTAGAHEVQFSATKLAVGTYFIKLESNGQTINKVVQIVR